MGWCPVSGLIRHRVTASPSIVLLLPQSALSTRRAPPRASLPGICWPSLSTFKQVPIQPKRKSLPRPATNSNPNVKCQGRCGGCLRHIPSRNVMHGAPRAFARPHASGIKAQMCQWVPGALHVHHPLDFVPLYRYGRHSILSNSKLTQNTSRLRSCWVYWRPWSTVGFHPPLLHRRPTRASQRRKSAQGKSIFFTPTVDTLSGSTFVTPATPCNIRRVLLWFPRLIRPLLRCGWAR